ncbi:MAG: alpha/beta hydrolase [Chloroflexi bacterium]|nr:MAG: alpha/beta hydrolase [Chloroflexota bacterium]
MQRGGYNGSLAAANVGEWGYTLNLKEACLSGQQWRGKGSLEAVTTMTLPEAAQPFTFEGNATGVLLVHGWLGLPGELRPLGAYLARQGYTVAAPLLAGHGGHPEALHSVSWQAWYASVATAYQALAVRCGQVVVLGYSLGGLLALELAGQQPVAGIITLAGALVLAGGWPLRALVWGRFVLPWLYPMHKANFADPQLRAELSSKLGPVDFDDPAVVANLRTTLRISTRSIYEVIRLGQHVRRALPRVTAPALIMQGRRDTTVLPESADQLYRLLGSREKQIAWFERSGHLLPNDIEREQVWQQIAQWIAHHTEPTMSAQTAPPE